MKLRPMDMGDAMRMWKWKNYPETRKFAIVSRNKIPLNKHLSWLGNNLKFFKVIYDPSVTPEMQDEVFGAVRVQDKEVSIWIDKAYWGKDFATKIVRKVSKKGYTAKIVEGHVASMRVFINAGFKPISYQKGYYIFQKQ